MMSGNSWQTLVPNPYIGIITCGLLLKRDKGSPFGHEADCVICTSDGHILEFCRHSVTHCCKIPFQDGKDILEFNSYFPFHHYYVIVSSAGGVCIVGTKEFKVVKTWLNACRAEVDDYLNAGVAQLKVSFPAGEPLLTDLQYDYKPGDKNISAVTTDNESSISAACRALQSRLKLGKDALKSAESRTEERGLFIQQTLESLRSYLLHEENPVIHEPFLVNILGKLRETSVTAVECLSWLPPLAAQEASVASVLSSTALKLGSTWQRTLGKNWIIGISMKNMSDKTVHRLQLILTCNDRTLWYHTHVFTLRHTTRTSSSADSATLLSRRKKLKLESEPCGQNLVNELEDDPVVPQSPVFITAVIDMPVFSSGQAVSVTGLLLYRVQTGGREDENDADHYQMPIKEIRLTVKDVVKESLEVKLEEKKGNVDVNEDYLALLSVLSAESVKIQCHHGTLRSLETNLIRLGFIKKPSLNCYFHEGQINPALKFCLVNLSHVTPKQTNMKMYGRDTSQLLLFVHALYDVLPHDVTVLPHVDIISCNSKQEQNKLEMRMESLKKEVNFIADKLTNYNSAFCNDSDTEADQDDLTGSDLILKEMKKGKEIMKKKTEKIAINAKEYMQFRKVLYDLERSTDVAFQC